MVTVGLTMRLPSMAPLPAMKVTPPTVDRLQWFAGDKDALDLYLRLAHIAHAWDDLIDRDKPVDVNGLMANLLLYLPANPCYRRYEAELRGLIVVSMTCYMAANKMERTDDDHKRELAHFLRYGVMTIGAFLIGATNGVERGAQVLADAAPVMVPERLAEYLKEHEPC